ncbi:MAG: hypothetical protein ACRDOI_24915, partial [Trebonia sp.]
TEQPTGAPPPIPLTRDRAMNITRTNSPETKSLKISSARLPADGQVRSGTGAITERDKARQPRTAPSADYALA